MSEGKYINKGAFKMSAIRQEILEYINELPDIKLEAIKPILAILVDNNISVETDLTDEEKDIIKRGRKEYENGNFVSLESLN